MFDEHLTVIFSNENCHIFPIELAGFVIVQKFQKNLIRLVLTIETNHD